MEPRGIRARSKREIKLGISSTQEVTANCDVCEDIMDNFRRQCKERLKDPSFSLITSFTKIEEQCL